MADSSLPENWGTVSDKDRGLIEEIRRQMSGQLSAFYDTDFNLKRWLVGWNYDLEKILPRLRRHMAYRRCLNLDAPEDQFDVHPVMAEYYPQCYFDHTSGLGKRNELVQILCLGKIDVNGVMHSVPSIQYTASRVYYTEKCLRKIMALEKTTGRQAGMIHILDAEGFTLDAWSFKAATGPFKELNCLLQENYVEVTNKVIVINAGNIVYTLWRLIQPFLAQRSREKVHILSSNWRQEILQYVDAASLPPPWGGTLTNWEHLLVVPRPVPVDLYYKPSREDELSETALQPRTIPRNSFSYDVVELTDDDVTAGRRLSLKWYAKSDYCTSLRFGAFYSPTNPKIDPNTNLNTDSFEMLQPKFVCYITVMPIRGEMICSKAGYYIFEFGSTTLLFSQTIYCNVSHSFV